MNVRRLVARLAVVLSAAVPALADFYSTSVSPNARTLSLNGGEAQSTIVPPDTKPQCKFGRFLVSDGWRRPPLQAGDSPSFHPDVASLTKGVVHWRNLGGLVGVNTPNHGVSTFAPPPDVHPAGTRPRPHRWGIFNADHRLVTLPNGDVIYQRVALTREPIHPKPKWSAFTSRHLGTGFLGPATPIDWEPDARSTLLTWRSTNCGDTFEFVNEIDQFGPGYEECANPQPGANGLLPKFDLGGTDGPNLVVDRPNATLFATFQCAGRILGPDVNREPRLTDAFVNKTFIFSWKPSDGTAKFIKRGFYSPAVWGAPAVPLPDRRLAVSDGSTGVKVGKAESGTKPYQFTSDYVMPEGAGWGWANDFGATQIGQRFGVAGFYASTLATRIPKSQKVLLTFPSKVGSANGYRVFAYDPDETDPKLAFTEYLPEITPHGTAAESAIVHLVAVDPGNNGPILLYWHDIQGGATMQSTIRGRVIYDDLAQSNDFDISLDDGQPEPFGLTEAIAGSHPYFYGDYHTAAGYATNSGDVLVYHYYPMWVQPWPAPKHEEQSGGSVHFNHVTVTRTPMKAVQQRVVQFLEPPEMVFTECCDWLPMLEKLVTTDGNVVTGPNARQAAQAKMAKDLLEADPNLKNTRLRVAVNRNAKTVARRAVPATGRDREAFGKFAEEHRRQGK